MTGEQRGRATYFATPEAFRRWLEKHAATAQELFVGFHKRSSGRKSQSWQESVDEALCYGWIDGVRHTVDDERYTIRFTPRRPTSRWSAINLDRVKVLTAEGRMKAAGLAIHAGRKSPEQAGYSYDSTTPVPWRPAHLRTFKRDRAAWGFFAAQAPSYQKLIRFWVESAKQEETRQRRLERAIATSGKGKRL